MRKSAVWRLGGTNLMPVPISMHTLFCWMQIGRVQRHMCTVGLEDYLLWGGGGGGGGNVALYHPPPPPPTSLTIDNAPWLRSCSTGLRTRLGVQSNSSKFQIVRLPVEPALSVFTETAYMYRDEIGDQRGTTSLPCRLPHHEC